MIFRELELERAYVIDLEPREDERGFNARSWCRREFEEHGIPVDIAQANVIYNRHLGTLRGMHRQAPPHAESKLFRCTRGAVFDAIVDLRPGSRTYGRWTGVELRAEDYRMLFVPEQFGQGFITLADDTELTYQVSEFYEPGHELGFRYDDRAFAIEWPIEVAVISEKDRSWPPFEADSAGAGGGTA